MAECVVSLLLKKLDTVLTGEYKLIEGLQREVRDIRDELGSMRAFLRIAEAEQDAGVLDDEQKEWVKQVLKVAFDTEDAVDEFLLRFAQSNVAGFRGHIRHMYTYIKNLLSRHKISSKIRDIKYKVKEISDRHQRYRSMEGISEISSSNRNSDHPIRGHGLLLTEADLVGIDRPKREIVSLILTHESHRKAISMVGMGGLGKTTLVKRVYETVKGKFSTHAWLTISETFKIQDALKILIDQLFKEVKQPIPGEVDSMDIDRLRAFVNTFLKDKRYIVVLDDLWKLEHWDSIKYVFPDDSCGSRIIITTRIKDLAKTCCHQFSGNVHEMQPLSDDDSWQLFCRTTFREDECPPHLVNISRSIMNKCEGLPLGIVAIGGLLALKDTRQEWEIVLRSLGGELEGSGKLDQVRNILLLSYNDLPYYLKCCLLYMGMFPEDAIVDADDLIYLWMAEGFVEARQGMTTLEVAESYLNDLVGRSLIHVVDTEPDGKIESCRVHDLIYKIILSKCKEYNILQAASTPNTVQLENVRRLVIDESTFPKEPVHLLHLRSIITSYKSHSSISDSSLSKLLKGTSKLLKVLYLASSDLKIIPDEVFKLSNLTYLSLAGNNVKNIPRSIRQLQNLEYLFLNFTEVRELPADIIMLKKLYLLWIGVNFLYDFDHSSIWGCRPPSGLGALVSFHHLSLIGGCRAPSGFGALVSLHHLNYIEADSENVIQEIGKLTQLRTLGITKVERENGRALCSSLEKLTNLQELYIHAITRNEIIDLDYSSLSNLQFLQWLKFVGRLEKIPHWVPSCHGLSTLILFHSCLIENPLGCLEVMPNLVDLRLIDAYTGDTLNFKAGGFQKLKKLVLTGLSGLKLMTFEKGTLPELETLTIENCKLIEELPQDIQYLAKLKTLSLMYMPTRLGNSLRNLNKESDGYQKIAHIGEIIIESFVNGKWKTEYVKW